MVGLAARNIWLDFSVICSDFFDCRFYLIVLSWWHSLCGELVIVVTVRDTVVLQSWHWNVETSELPLNIVWLTYFYCPSAQQCWGVRLI